MSKLSNKNDPEPKKVLKGLKGGLLAQIHDSMESIRFKSYKLENLDFHGSMETAVEICDQLISNTIDDYEYKEQAKLLGPFAAEYMLHSFSLTF